MLLPLARLAMRYAASGNLSAEQIRDLCVSFAELGFFDNRFNAAMAEGVLTRPQAPAPAPYPTPRSHVILSCDNIARGPGMKYDLQSGHLTITLLGFQQRVGCFIGFRDHLLPWVHTLAVPPSLQPN